VFDVNTDSKLRILHTYDMDVEWFGFILGMAIAKECTMAHGWSLSKNLKKTTPYGG
jgi:hypothetical protein